MPYVCFRLISTLSIFLLATQTCGGQDSLELVPGDVTIGTIFSVNNIHNDGCGDYNVESLKEMMAVKWFLDTINSLNYIPGVKIGEIGKQMLSPALDAGPDLCVCVCVLSLIHISEPTRRS